MRSSPPPGWKLRPPPWSDPHADGAVRDEEYSQCLAPGKYRMGADNPCHPLRDLSVFMDQPSEPVVPDDAGLLVFGGLWGRVETVWRSLSE